MSAPLGLSFTSELISALSSLNMFPDDKTEGQYISELYPETISASHYINTCFDFCNKRTNLLFHLDEIGIKNASYKGKFNFLDFVSFSDELVYRKYLFLARSELLKIKDKHYEIEHSIEHIDCALSFVVPFFENDVIEKLCFDAFSSGKITFDHFVNQLSSYIVLKTKENL